MSPSRFSFALLLLFLAGCASDSAVAARFRAERSLWRLNREAKRLSIRRDLVRQEDWATLAKQYEHVAEESASTSAPEVRALAARALISASGVYGSVGDSVAMLALYDRIEKEYGDLPTLAGEVTLARGVRAQARGDWQEAAACYRQIMETVPPKMGESGVSGMVLPLPLRLAVMQVNATGAETVAEKRPYLEEAQRYYEKIITTYPGTLNEWVSRARLSDVFGHLQEWERAIAELRKLEAALSQLKESPLDPAQVRFSIATAQASGRMSADVQRATLTSLVEDYPKSDYAVSALFYLVKDAVNRGDVEQALALLGRVEKEHPDREEDAARAMLERAMILERNDRWAEALPILRELPIQHPITEPALNAPIEVVNHYTRTEDSTSRAAAIDEAEKTYREFMERYPSGQHTHSARFKLAQTLILQERFPEAVSELLNVGEALKGTTIGAQAFLAAANVKAQKLGDPKGAAEVLDRAAELFAGVDFGRWAATRAAELRKEPQP